MLKLFLTLLILPSMLLAMAQADEISSSSAESASQTGRPSETGEDNPHAVLTLKGRVEHSVSLPPLGSALRAGAVFDESLLGNTSQDEGWYQIPEWLAGSFHRETLTTRLGLFTVKVLSRTDYGHGYQRDRSGKIWNYYHVPQRQIVEGSTFDQIFVTRWYQPLMVTDETVVLRFMNTCIRVEKGTGKILDVFQQEEIHKLTAVSGGSYRGAWSLRTFTSAGVKTGHVQHGSYVAVRTGPFSPIDALEGRDLRASFARFLISHGHSELVPEDSHEAVHGTLPVSRPAPVHPRQDLDQEPAN